MFSIPPSVRIFLATEPTDMRKGFDGLAALIEAQSANVYGGHLYVFLSKRRDRAKILFWERGGFVLWYKRLERGRFRLPTIGMNAASVELDGPQLSMLLDGVDLTNVRRGKFWTPPEQKSA